MSSLVVEKKYGYFQINDIKFEGAKNANKCLLFDKVEYKDSKCILVERADHPILIGVLQTMGPKYGYTSRKQPIYLCKPFDSLYPPFYVSSKLYDTLKNKLISFKFYQWEEKKEFPQGTIVDFIGDCGNIIAEKKAVLIHASPYSWPKTLNTIVAPSFENRMKLKGFTFNIDPDGCKDVDDCITIWDNSIAISIADVSAWVEANPWMKYAEKIGTSLYDEGKCVKPMFPRNLSEDLMSLVEKQDRLAYSLIITFTDDSISYEFKETIVHIDKSYTYDSVYNDTELNTSAIKNIINRLSGIETDDSHKWIEILMLTYNKKAGDILKQKNSGILRKQNGVNLERAKLFKEFSEEYMFLCYESAKYCLPEDNTLHSMLNIENYAHASSPIRRYVDIINQFALKEKQFTYENLERFNIQQKRAKNYERDLVYIDLYENKRILDAIVLDNKTMFVSHLKKIIKFKNDLKKGDAVKLNYYLNPQGVRWKEKIVFGLA